MKNIVYYILFSVLCSLWACNETPTFPDPGLDATKSANDTIRRDTANSYDLLMDIKAPNGIERVQILNGLNYRKIDEVIEGYEGKTDVHFKYTVDVSNIDKDTTMYYIVKVIDQKLRSYNKGFTLRVLKHSRPEITVVGGADNWGLQRSKFQIKMLFETGLNTIKSWRMLFNGKVTHEETFDQVAIHEYKYKGILDLEMREDTDYPLLIELVDSKGDTAVKKINLRLVKGARPKRVELRGDDGKIKRGLDFAYDESGRLDSLNMSSHVWNRGKEKITRSCFYFEYGENGMVNRWWQRGGSAWIREYTYVAGTKNLLTLKDPKNAAHAYDITVTDWNEDGSVKNFMYGVGMKVEDLHYTNDIMGNGKLFSEFWASTVADAYRQYCDGMTPQFIPTYFPQLSPVIIPTPAAGEKEWWGELFSYEYVFEQRVRRADGKVMYTVGAVQDISGRMLSLTRRDAEGETIKFTFLYE